MGEQGTAIKIATMVVAPLLCALAVLGGIGSFTTIRQLAAPWFGTDAWTVPVGVDAGIVALLAWDLLAEYLGISWAVIRWTAWTFIAGTVYLNIAAAHGNPVAAVMHAAMPALFIIVTEGIRHLIRQVAGLANGTRIESIPAGRWLLAPWSSYQLWRHMILWHITSYAEALALERQRQRAIARLQKDHGRWRWRAPLADRFALRSGPPDEGPDVLVSKRDVQLVEATKTIIRDAERDGVRLSQAALARQLRDRGHTVANERLRWLIATVSRENEPAPSEEPRRFR
jgi:hypothetical protein